MPSARTRPARPGEGARAPGRSARPLAPAAALVLLALLAAHGAARASGPYRVDDAAITPAGGGQLETWVSLTRRGHAFEALPATTLKALPFLEWSAGLDTGRFDGARTTGLTLQAKGLFGAEPATPGAVGFAASGAVRFGLDGAGATDLALNGIMTLVASDRLLLHGNLGLAEDRLDGDTALTWGARAEAALLPGRLSIHAELFGSTQTRAGFQLGLRPTILDGAMDLELVFSRNLSDERERWATMGFALRF